MVPEGGLEPPQAQGPSDFESDASTSSTTPALVPMYYQSSPRFASEEPRPIRESCNRGHMPSSATYI